MSPRPVVRNLTADLYICLMFLISVNVYDVSSSSTVVDSYTTVKKINVSKKNRNLSYFVLHFDTHLAKACVLCIQEAVQVLDY